MCLFSSSVLPKGTKAPGDLAGGKGRGPERLPDLLKGYMETRLSKGWQWTLILCLVHHVML